MKVCPVCMSRCFDDMDTCYGCLHKFSLDTPQSTNNVQCVQRSQPTSKVERFIPEYFEVEDNIDKYIMLEDVEDFLRRRAWEGGQMIEASARSSECLCISNTEVSSDKTSVTIKLCFA